YSIYMYNFITMVICLKIWLQQKDCICQCGPRTNWVSFCATDMDTKVKAMIKLINEDADSFARRAEMYYKKRPELMKLVEEFYRAYRALAERYDQATGAL